MRISAIALSLLLCGCSSKSAGGEVTDAAQQELYIQISSAYAPLSECLQPFLSGGRASALRASAYRYSQSEPANFKWFVSQASQYVNLDSVGKSAEDSVYAEGILKALADFSQNDSDTALSGKIRRAKAMAVAMIYLSGGTDGKCAPNMQLFQWM